MLVFFFFQTSIRWVKIEYYFNFEQIMYVWYLLFNNWLGFIGMKISDVSKRNQLNYRCRCVSTQPQNMYHDLMMPSANGLYLILKRRALLPFGWVALRWNLWVAFLTFISLSVCNWSECYSTISNITACAHTSQLDLISCSLDWFNYRSYEFFPANLIEFGCKTPCIFYNECDLRCVIKLSINHLNSKNHHVFSVENIHLMEFCEIKVNYFNFHMSDRMECITYFEWLHYDCKANRVKKLWINGNNSLSLDCQFSWG